MTLEQGDQVILTLGLILDVMRAGYVLLAAVLLFVVLGAVRWR